MLSQRDLGWIAGLVEGEGCVTFTGNRCPTLSIGMTDEDTIRRAAQLLSVVSKIETWQRSGEKRMFRLHVRGKKAVGWLLTLYPLLGQRRKGRVRDVVRYWRTHGRNAQS